MTLRTGCSRGRTPKVVRPQQRKNPLPFPISQRSHVGNLRQTIQGKGVIHKRVETAGVYPLVRPRGVSALPAEVQRKTFRPLGANTLTQFEYPAQPVLKKGCRPERANPLTQFVSPAQPVLKKGCRPSGANPPAAVRVPQLVGAENIYKKSCCTHAAALFHAKS